MSDGVVVREYVVKLVAVRNDIEVRGYAGSGHESHGQFIMGKKPGEVENLIKTLDRGGLLPFLDGLCGRPHELDREQRR